MFGEPGLVPPEAWMAPSVTNTPTAADRVPGPYVSRTLFGVTVEVVTPPVGLPMLPPLELYTLKPAADAVETGWSNVTVTVSAVLPTVTEAETTSGVPVFPLALTSAAAR